MDPWQTDWIIRCAAHLVLANRKAGGNAGLALAPVLHAADNIYANLRDTAMQNSVDDGPPPLSPAFGGGK